MKDFTKITVQFGVILFAVSLFTGCKFLWWGKEEKVVTPPSQDRVESRGGEGVTLLNINGKSVLTESDFNNFLAQMLQSHPYFRGAGPEVLPFSVKRKFFDELVKQELIVAWAKDNNIENNSEFKKAYEEVKKLAKRSLLIQQFEKNLFEGINVSNSDIEKEFKQNKDKFIKVAGGVLVSGISFEDKEKANAFYDKVKNKTKASEFIDLAKKENEEKFKDFGRVGKAPKAAGPMMPNDVPMPLRNKVTALTKLPAIEKIDVGRIVWVVHVSDKKDDTYFDLEEIKPQIEMMLRNNKFREVLDKEITKLQKSYTVDINEDFFKKAEQREAAEREGKKEAAEIEKETVAPVAAT